MFISSVIEKKKNAADLKRMSEAAGERMRQKDFEELCLKIIGYTTNPWEIEEVKKSKTSIGEPRV